MIRLSLDVSAIPERPAGAGRYAVEMAAGLATHYGSHLNLIARTNDAERWASIAPKAEVHAVVPERRPLRLVWEQTTMPSVVGRLGAHVHLGPHYTIPERAKAAKIATIHDMFFFDNPEWHERAKVPVFRRAIRAAVKKADALVAVSNYTERSVRRRFGAVDITTIPLGVDHDRFNMTAAPDELGKLAGHGVHPPFVAFVGTIEPRKNVPALLRAFDRIAADVPDLSLVVAGRTGWKGEEFDATLASMRHRDRVVRPGWVQDDVLPALLRNAKAVAYPSFAEGFGLPVLEALACGAALVTSKDSAMSEVVDGAALLADPHDDSDLEAQLRRLLEGDREILEMRARGASVAGRYTWTKTVEAHIELIEKVARS